MKICPKCNACYNDDAAFCAKCGTKLVEKEEKVITRFCPKCGEKFTSEVDFCPKCGFNLNKYFSEEKAKEEKKKVEDQKNSVDFGFSDFDKQISSSKDEIIKILESYQVPPEKLKS